MIYFNDVDFNYEAKIVIHFKRKQLDLSKWQLETVCFSIQEWLNQGGE